MDQGYKQLFPTYKVSCLSRVVVRTDHHAVRKLLPTRAVSAGCWLPREGAGAVSSHQPGCICWMCTLGCSLRRSAAWGILLYLCRMVCMARQAALLSCWPKTGFFSTLSILFPCCFSWYVRRWRHCFCTHLLWVDTPLKTVFDTSSIAVLQPPYFYQCVQKKVTPCRI